MERLYISLPITGKDEQHQRTLADRWVNHFSDQYEVVNPFTIYDALVNSLADKCRKPTYDEIMQEDLKELRQCDVIFMCRGFAYSNGCMDEFVEARKIGLTFIFENDIITIPVKTKQDGTNKTRNRKVQKTV